METAAVAVTVEMPQEAIADPRAMVPQAAQAARVAKAASGWTGSEEDACDASGGEAESGPATGGQGLDCADSTGGGANCQVMEEQVELQQLLRTVGKPMLADKG